MSLNIKLLVVARITNNVERYPDCAEDTEKYPHIIKYVDDEMDLFIVDPDNPQMFWPAAEFFYMVGVTSLIIHPEELK